MNKNKHDIKIALVILAAGESTRMGSIKQLLPWKSTTLLGQAIQQGLSSDADSVFVVLGAHYNKIVDTIMDHRITIIENKDWSSGMGSSIACAMKFIERNDIHFDAVLISLSDQPFIEYKYFNKLINSFLKNNKNIVATQTKSRAGVPSIFGLDYFKALSELKNDIGAREIIATNLNDVFIERTGDLNIDIDTENSYKTLYNKYGR
ncbi:MAG: nucleotidyltransferase family protein [Bacteroidota bacterium]